MGSSAPKTQTSTSSSSSKSKSSNTPYQQKYMDQQLGEAQNLYENYGMPQHYGGATVAGMSPAQMESMNLASNWITGGAQDMMGGMNSNYNDMMSGRVNTGAGSPYGDMANVYQQQAMEQAQDMMGGLRSSQVMSGQAGGSTRGDLLNNQVIEDANKNVSQNMAGMYNNAYNQAQNTRNNALGQYGNVMNMPLGMSNAMYNQVGLPQQQLNQKLMDDAKGRYDYNSMNPYRNLQMFQNNISGNMGGTQQQTSSQSGSQTTPVQGGGGLGSLGQIAGIGATLMGIPGGGMIQGLLSGMGSPGTSSGVLPQPTSGTWT